MGWGGRGVDCADERGMDGVASTGSLCEAGMFVGGAQQVVRAAEMGARRQGLGRQGRGLR